VRAFGGRACSHPFVRWRGRQGGAAVSYKRDATSAAWKPPGLPVELVLQRAAGLQAGRVQPGWQQAQPKPVERAWPAWLTAWSRPEARKPPEQWARLGRLEPWARRPADCQRRDGAEPAQDALQVRRRAYRAASAAPAFR